MEDFDNAQKLFGSFQKHGKFSDLRESLDILETLIGHQGIESKRASNLRKIISDHIDSELNAIYAKGNIDEFGKGLTLEEAAGLMLEALDKRDLIRFGQFLRIKKRYFE